MFVGILHFNQLVRVLSGGSSNNWDDMKQYSKKSIGIMIGIIVVSSFVIGFVLIEGQKQMEKMSIFQEWMSSAKGLYLVLVVVIFLKIVISIASYILKGK